MNIRNRLILSVFLAFGLVLGAPAKASEPPVFSQAELDSMLAPVALYPDSVLSHVLIAATYPLEVVQAARWSRNHPGLHGEDAVEAVEYKPWDPSVKALAAFPELLRRMDDDLDWTQRLGDAFLIQEADVLASIQYLRDEAYASGNLRSNDYVRVVRETEYIYIEPRRTRVVYVPYYDPRVVYTSWRWHHHRPYYWSRPSGFNVSIGFHWGSGYHIRPDFYFSSFHWQRRHVVSVHHHHVHLHDWKKPHKRFHSGRDVARHDGARHWKHNPTHRRGVSYHAKVDRSRFVQARTSSLQQRGGRDSGPVAQTKSGQRELAVQRRSELRQLSSRGSDGGGDANRSSLRSASATRGSNSSRQALRSSRGDVSASSRSSLGPRSDRSATVSRSSRGDSSSRGTSGADDLGGRLKVTGDDNRNTSSVQRRSSRASASSRPARRSSPSVSRSSSDRASGVSNRKGAVESRRSLLDSRREATPSRSVQRSRSTSRVERSAPQRSSRSSVRSSRSESPGRSSRSSIQSSRGSAPSRSGRSDSVKRSSGSDRSKAARRVRSRDDDR